MLFILLILFVGRGGKEIGPFIGIGCGGCIKNDDGVKTEIAHKTNGKFHLI